MTDFTTSPARVLVTGFLMGLANLVPGVSGGTMVLAMGLYDRFILAVARLTTLKLSRGLIVFLALLGLGLVVALVGLSGPAVYLVAHHRWVMYSLFIGMTLGGAPELVRLSSPMGGRVMVAAAVGFLCMLGLFLGLGEAQVPHNALTFALVGALAASSMILPGVSGSYILLIFGMYDVVIGSLSAGAVREDPVGSISVVGPVVLGALVGIGLLSNLLKAVLARHSGPAHGFLLGLLVGAVVGLWPFQQSVHPELATRSERKAVAALVEGAGAQQVREEFGVAWDDAKAADYAETHDGKSRGELKADGMDLERFRPGVGQILAALALALAGFLTTLLLGGGAHDSSERDS